MTSDLNISRRSMLAGVAGIVAAPMVLGAKRAAAKSDRIVISNYGGSYQDACVKAVFDPFTKETGIRVDNVPVPGLDKVRAMQLTRNVEIDIWLGVSAQCAAGSRLGLWEKLDSTLFDLQDLTIQPASDYVLYELVAQGICFDPKKYGPGKYPSDFAEFFDLKKYPGRRSLRKRPDSMLEVALLGDGVAPKDIYPLDLDRAFKALDRIKSNVVWAQTAPQPITLLQTGEVDFSIVQSNRAKATHDAGGGTPLDFSFKQTVTDALGLAILKGALNQDAAKKLIAYFLRPETLARFEDVVGAAPVSKKAATMLLPDARKWQPDLNSTNSLVVSADYWADNFEAVNRRYLEWLSN
ncbi:ABC transporter substrate-binding protein [Bradyrhizobium zhanjiangense]|uniref:ABC transporter substrate-binding protein n=1 Tax=Bradyrhizobium zhanjiangense TaxID=1325107 RepID=UPI0013E8ACBD|nr:ABC transporter substrate-binding protein [Bradyrhizobium zhanjiangense]